MKKSCNIDYRSSLPHLIDVNWLYISYKVTKKKKSEESSKKLNVNTEVVISEFFEKPCLLIIKRKVK